jgi:hypothetical protein
VESPQRDPFLRRLDSASGLTVDIGHMKNVSTYLATLASAVRGDVMDTARRADQAMRVGRYEQSVLGGERMPEVPALAQRTHAVYEAVNANLADIATALTQTAQAIERIAATYSSQELNRLPAADLLRLLPQSTRTPTHGR